MHRNSMGMEKMSWVALDWQVKNGNSNKHSWHYKLKEHKTYCQLWRSFQSILTIVKRGRFCRRCRQDASIIAKCDRKLNNPVFCHAIPVLVLEKSFENHVCELHNLDLCSVHKRQRTWWLCPTKTYITNKTIMQEERTSSLPKLGKEGFPSCKHTYLCPCDR